MAKYLGGCHCQKVCFEVDLMDSITVQECNCSICTKLGFLHIIVPKAKFKLIRGKDQLTQYQFNTGQAKHLFCKHCGVKSFYIPRSNPDGLSINLRCLESVPPDVKIEPFDGQNWEHHAHHLAHLSHSD